MSTVQTVIDMLNEAAHRVTATGLVEKAFWITAPGGRVYNWYYRFQSDHGLGRQEYLCCMTQSEVAGSSVAEMVDHLTKRIEESMQQRQGLEGVEIRRREIINSFPLHDTENTVVVVFDDESIYSICDGSGWTKWVDIPKPGQSERELAEKDIIKGFEEYQNPDGGKIIPGATNETRSR